ncbi:podocalyxin isoform X1 [Strix uralensis]|uniref:podocalyxin isoform X1 n=1 Tax=Strix uralensis TaxID=36305 RepID=UPI003DA733C6
MRAPLLLPLLLLGVSSHNVTNTLPENPGENGQNITITASSKTNGTTGPTGHSENTPPTSAVSLASVQGTTSTNNLGNPHSTSATPSVAVQGTTSTNNPGNPSSALTTLLGPSQQVSSSTGSKASTATPPAATSSITQQKTTPPAILGSPANTTVASPVSIHVSSPPVNPGGLETAVTPTTSVATQGSQPSDQVTNTTASTGVPGSNLPPGVKDNALSSTTSVAKQPHSSSSSPVQGLASSTRPGNISASVTPFDGSMFLTTSKVSLSLPPGSIDKVSEVATTPTPGADEKSHDTRSVSTEPASVDWSPASTQPSAPAPGDQTVSSSLGHQHPNVSFQNEFICKDQVQNNGPIMYLKEAKTCAEWKTASINVSFFESFCSTGQHAFNASRETCTVTLSSPKSPSQQWAVRAVVHLPLDPEKVLEELKEKKDKLEELGIANITYDKMQRDLIINDEFSTPLIITIVTLAGSLLLIAAIYGCCHQRFSQKKDQHIHPDLPGFDDGHVALIFNQRLTEELQTMENGYHDNPTLEVMETSSEMQEKKVNLNGELGDSWIVPLDTLMKEDLEEEEDTHL